MEILRNIWRRKLTHFAIGDEVHEEAESNLVSYYGEFGSRVWQGTVKTVVEAVL